MKISKAFLIFQLAAAKPNLMGGKLAETVTRKLQGDFINKFFPRHRRDEIQGAKGFKPLAAMILYMQGFDSEGQNPGDHDDFVAEMQKIENVYTNYGCYCWIDGKDKGVIGGGRTKDMSDHHCKELYRCYKCVNVDYSANYTDVDYRVDFTADNGNRHLDCSINSKQDAENICECDKRFAENIAATEASCKGGAGDDDRYGAYCIDEQWRTTSGNVLGTSNIPTANMGTFDPHVAANCDKKMHGHDKDNCCGIYPNRYPYDKNERDCCQTTISDGFDGQTKAFNLVGASECEGTVVVSEEGNPHSYVAVGSSGR